MLNRAEPKISELKMQFRFNVIARVVSQKLLLVSSAETVGSVYR